MPYLFKLPPSQRRIVAQLRRDARKADDEVLGMQATYPWYVNSYIRMLYRRPDINKPLRDPTTDKELGILDRVTRRPTQAVIDMYYGKNHSIGPNQVRGQLRESNEVVGDYLPISYKEWKALERRGNPYWAAEIHDIDLFRGTHSAEQYKNLVFNADNAFERATGISVPRIAHGVDMAPHGPLHTPESKKRSAEPPALEKKMRPVNLYGDAQGEILQPSLGFLLDQAADDDSPPEYDTPPAAQLNIAQPHNISDEAGIPMNQFADTRKLPTTDCGLGKSDKLSSPYATFLGRFKAKRSIATNWHHTGSSEMNKRSMFTYMFRHCVSLPNPAAVLSPATADIKKAAVDGVITISSAEKQVATGAYDGQAAPTPDNKATWYSPYALRELETVSWNINNFKLKPYQPGVYSAAAEYLPGRVNKDDIGFNADDSLLTDKSVNPHVVHSDSTYQNAALGLEFYGGTPYVAVRPNTQDEYLQDSIVRSTNRAIDSQTPEFSKLGHYAVQLGQGHLYFTFVNTGDTTMLVDAVVHQAKKDTCVGAIYPIPTLPRDPLGIKNMNDIIAKPYMVNYLTAHQANSDRKVSNYVRHANDVVQNPETKFLPTSYRLGKKVDLLGAFEDGEVFQVDDGETGVASTYQIPTGSTGYADRAAAEAALAAYKSGDVQHLEVVELTADNIKAGSGHEAGKFAIFQIIQMGNPGFIDIQRKSISVPPNSRKTIHMIMPAVKYDPLKSFYNGYFNDQSYCVSFGVTGKTTKVVVPAGDNIGADGVSKPMSSQFIGRTAAPTSFHIFGHESQTIYPVYLHEEEDKASQINRLRDPQMASGDNALQAASYIGAAGRTGDGRFAHLLTDGQPTKKQKIEFDQAKKLSEISASSGGATMVFTVDNIIMADGTSVNLNPAAGGTSTLTLTNTTTSFGSWYFKDTTSKPFTADWRAYIAAALNAKKIPMADVVHLPGAYSLNGGMNVGVDLTHTSGGNGTGGTQSNTTGTAVFGTNYSIVL